MAFELLVRIRDAKRVWAKRKAALWRFKRKWKRLYLSKLASISGV